MALLPDTERYKLRFGPYLGPRLRIGDACQCEIRGLVEVSGWTGAPIAWPQGRAKGRRRAIIVCGDLLRALRHESADALCYHFGVQRSTVWRWRSALKIDSRAVDGYVAVMKDFGDINGEADWRPDHLAKVNPREAWTPGEMAHLGTDTDAKVGSKIKRTTAAVKHARQRAGVRRK